MVEQSKAGVNTEVVYDCLGNELDLMNGISTQVKAYAPLPGGGTAVYQPGSLYYYRYTDWLGSSRFSSTPGRAMHTDLAFAPYGEQYAVSGNVGVQGASFAGNPEDTTTNLYDAQFREYGIQGRWPSPDPAGIAAANPANPQSWNRYAYSLNNPVIFIDPSGFDVPTGGGQCSLDVPCVAVACDDVRNAAQCFGVDDSFSLDDPFGFYGQLEIFGNPKQFFARRGDLCGGGDCVSPTPQKPPTAKQQKEAQCRSDAVIKAENAIFDSTFHGFHEIGKQVVEGTAVGAVGGCLLAIEVGCLEGAVPGALGGAFEGVLNGGARAIYGNIQAFNAANKQLQQDLAACSAGN